MLSLALPKGSLEEQTLLLFAEADPYRCATHNKGLMNGTDAVVMATYLKQAFENRMGLSVSEIRETAVRAAQARIRPCFMTTITTALALIPLALRGVRYRPQFGDDAGTTVVLSPRAVCDELRRVETAFSAYTGRRLDAVWRAPGGRTTPKALAAARDCGFAHVGWAPAGFLGDELPSDQYPNDRLLARALRDIRDGDVLMAHLGIWSRKDPYAPMLEPLIDGLKRRGLCFRTLREHPEYRPQAVPEHLAAATRVR